MLWSISFAVAAILIGLSHKAWGNPLTFLVAGYVGLCFALVGNVALKTRLGLRTSRAS